MPQRRPPHRALRAVASGLPGLRDGGVPPFTRVRGQGYAAAAAVEATGGLPNVPHRGRPPASPPCTSERVADPVRGRACSTVWTPRSDSSSPRAQETRGRHRLAPGEGPETRRPDPGLERGWPTSGEFPKPAPMRGGLGPVRPGPEIKREGGPGGTKGGRRGREGDSPFSTQVSSCWRPRPRERAPWKRHAEHDPSPGPARPRSRPAPRRTTAWAPPSGRSRTVYAATQNAARSPREPPAPAANQIGEVTSPPAARPLFHVPHCWSPKTPPSPRFRPGGASPDLTRGQRNTPSAAVVASPTLPRELRTDARIPNFSPEIASPRWNTTWQPLPAT